MVKGLAQWVHQILTLLKQWISPRATFSCSVHLHLLWSLKLFFESGVSNLVFSLQKQTSKTHGLIKGQDGNICPLLVRAHIPETLAVGCRTPLWKCGILQRTGIIEKSLFYLFLSLLGLFLLFFANGYVSRNRQAHWLPFCLLMPCSWSEHRMGDSYTSIIFITMWMLLYGKILPTKTPVWRTSEK